MEEKQFKDLKISSSDQVKSKVEPEEIEGIDLEKMKQTGEYFFRFFKQYDHKLDLEKAKKIM